MAMLKLSCQREDRMPVIVADAAEILRKHGAELPSRTNCWDPSAVDLSRLLIQMAFKLSDGDLACARFEMSEEICDVIGRHRMASEGSILTAFSRSFRGIPFVVMDAPPSSESKD